MPNVFIGNNVLYYGKFEHSEKLDQTVVAPLVFATSSAIFGRSANVENERVTRIKSLEIGYFHGGAHEVKPGAF